VKCKCTQASCDHCGRQPLKWKHYPSGLEITADEAASYIQLSNREVVRTVEIVHGLNVDLDLDGNVVGVEVLK